MKSTSLNMKRSNWLFLLSALWLTRMSGAAADAGFAVRPNPAGLDITCDGAPVATFVVRDPNILRPYFANLHALGGPKVTRNHPPLAGADATDHDTMHPGLWLAFGDINGQDFWRNKGRIEHVRFTEPPKAARDQLTFATECRLVSAAGAPLSSLTNRFHITRMAGAWMLLWDATFCSLERELVFGDQEEMGFGVRVATALAEKNGGVISSSSGWRTAKKTWGQPADWCDDSGVVDGQPAGITLMAAPANFRPSWWHNRDYGLMVANPFGREAMKQGTPSAVTVKRGDPLRLRFGAVFHRGSGYDPGQGYRWFVQTVGN